MMNLALAAFMLLLGSCVVEAEVLGTSSSPSYYVINGTKTGIDKWGGRPARRDILEMQNDPVSWSLYVQALTLMQSKNESYFLSYYQIAGLHGRPYIPWDNVQQTPGCPTTGYCTHNSVLFLSWHRPYLALYEQILTSYAQSLVQTYDASLRPTYQAAADSLRLVYWDWGVNSSIPAIITKSKISIVTGSGVKSVSNPFYQYKFQTFPLDPNLFPTDPNVASDTVPATYPVTVRGISKTGSSNNIALVNSNLAALSLMRNTWLAMVRTTSYDAFSSTAVQGQGSSLEGVHNGVHTAIGGAEGHMTYLSYSAFDPVFWLHHTNVDRLFALWQASNPTSLLVDFPEFQGTFVILEGSTSTISTGLSPFARSADGTWYDSHPASIAMKVFGYTYPGLNYWNHTVKQQQNESNVIINTLYNPTNTPAKRRSVDLIQSQQHREWFVDIGVSKFDLNGKKFMILIFLGDVPSDPSPSSSGCIGSFPVLPPPVSPTAVVSALPKVWAYTEFDLSGGLKQLGYDGQDVGVTTAVLKEKLKWRVTKFDGTLINTVLIPSLNITVHDEIVTPAASLEELPTYSQRMGHGDVTSQMGGVQ